MRLSTKNLVIAGFGIVIVVVLVLAFIGVRTTNKTTDLFTEYNRVAMLSVNVSDFEAAVNKGAYKAIMSAWFYDRSIGVEAEESLDNAMLSLAQAEEHVNIPRRVEMLKSWKENVTEYKKQIVVYLDNVMAVGDIMSGPLLQQAESIVAQLNDLSAKASAGG